MKPGTKEGDNVFKLAERTQRIYHQDHEEYNQLCDFLATTPGIVTKETVEKCLDLAMELLESEIETNTQLIPSLKRRAKKRLVAVTEVLIESMDSIGDGTVDMFDAIMTFRSRSLSELGERRFWGVVSSTIRSDRFLDIANMEGDSTITL